MSTLTLAFLNQFTVTLNGRTLQRFESDNARALLVYLVLEAQQAHRRNHLAALFWPEHADKDARNNLRQTLFKLRRTLKDDQRDPPFLQVNNQTVQWCADVDVDVWQLTAVFDQFTQEKTIDPDKLLALYAGPLLTTAGLDAGLGFEEWLLVKREQIHRQVMGVLAELTAQAIDQKAWQTAVKISSRQVALDPWREEAYQQLMRALVGQGQRSAALDAFTQCRDLLWQELGVTPMPQTVALYEQIKAGDWGQTEEDEAETAVSIQSVPLNHNLPTDLTPFIGREPILAQAAAQLADPACRLLTLNGLGGIGKTRLSHQLARHLLECYPDGIWIVNLVGLPTACAPEQLEAAVVAALPMTPGGTLPLGQQLINFLRQRQLLLILDNFEHILSTAPQVVQWLAAAPQVQCVVTSRQPLAVTGEWLLTVPPLNYPQEGLAEESDGFEAVRLFLQHARMRRADFPLSVVAEPFVVRICQLAEGHPLALELAAGWVDALSCREIAEELTAGLALLRDDGGQRPLRHVSIEQIMQQSWSRLTEAERMVLNKMALFAGGCTREAAQQVAGATLPLLKSLINRSLLRIEINHQQAARYVLHELVRHFALAVLAADGGLENGRSRHAHYYLHFLAAQEEALSSAQMIATMAQIQPEIDNIEVAWQWAIVHRQCALLEQTAPALTGFLHNNGRFAISLQQLKPALAARSDAVRLKNRLAYTLNMMSVETEQIHQLTSEVQAQAAVVNDPHEVAFACMVQGVTLRRSSQFASAWDKLEEGLSHLSAKGDPWLTAVLAIQLCALMPMLDRYDKEEQYSQLALQASEASGQPAIRFLVNFTLAQNAIRQGDMSLADVYAQLSLAALGDFPFPYQRAALLQMQGFVAFYCDQLERALHFFREALKVNRDAGDLSLTATVQGMIAGIDLREGRYDDAIRVAEEAIAAAYLTNDRWRKGQVLITLGLASYYAGNQAKAAECMAETLALADELAEPGLRILCLLGFVEWLGLLGERPLAAEVAATVQTHFKLIDAWQAEVDALCERFALVVDTAVAPDWPTLVNTLKQAIVF